ncbi:kptA [Symbiodinium sp. CCMP2456]|nr:kptA [Symbiodinium sp. CCMP2456]
MQSKGKGGDPPPTPHSRLERDKPMKERAEILPPTAKAKSGDAPSAGSGTTKEPSRGAQEDQRFQEAVIHLAEVGFTPFPSLQAGCDGSIKDLNEHRVSVAVTKSLKEGLTQMAKKPVATAESLLATFLASRPGFSNENLLFLLSSPTAEANQWFRFVYRQGSERPQLEPHGASLPWPSHKESTFTAPPIATLPRGTHPPLTRYGPKHVFLPAMVEVTTDPAGSLKKGKQTNQLNFGLDSVRFDALLLQIVTKGDLVLGDYVREWAGAEWSNSLISAAGSSLRLRAQEHQKSEEDIIRARMSRTNEKSRYELGRSSAAMLEEMSEEKLPDEILNGTHWNKVLIIPDDVPPDSILYFQSNSPKSTFLQDQKELLP